jgi:magnesium chelatase family protein
VSLAHHGVLFLDELPEFRRIGLDALGRALNDGAVTTCRGGLRATFPARTSVVGATDPCPCGWRGDASGRCSCSPERVKSYLGRLHGRLLDRFDMRIVLPAIRVADLQGGLRGESSSEVQRRVVAARELQTERHRSGLSAQTNAEFSSSELDRVVRLDAAGSDVLAKVADRLKLSADGFNRVRRVARTIADLDLSDTVRAPHVAEALQVTPLPLGHD